MYFKILYVQLVPIYVFQNLCYEHWMFNINVNCRITICTLKCSCCILMHDGCAARHSRNHSDGENLIHMAKNCVYRISNG